MRFFIKLMILVLIAALAGPFFIRGPDGRPLMTLGEAMPDWERMAATAQYQWQRLTGEVKSLASDAGSDDTGGKTRVYKYRDAAGNWVYADEPPPGGDAAVLYVDPNVNIIPPTPPPPSRSAPEQPAADDTADDMEPSLFLPSNAKRALDGAKDVQGVLDDRARQMDDATRDNQ
ncbi:MAG: hypothetical protein AAFN78_09000 [Pseudomonadota bacterium]